MKPGLFRSLWSLLPQRNALKAFKNWTPLHSAQPWLFIERASPNISLKRILRCRQIRSSEFHSLKRALQWKTAPLGQKFAQANNFAQARNSLKRTNSLKRMKFAWASTTALNVFWASFDPLPVRTGFWPLHESCRAMS